jgi:TRAP-type C4-dicarboxylate transport system permease small subunit
MPATMHPAEAGPSASAAARTALRLADTSDLAIAWICRITLLVTGTALLLLLFSNVVGRYALHGGGLPWAQELPERLFPWFIVAGIALAAQHGGHMSVEWLLGRLGPAGQRVLVVGGNLLVIAAYGVLCRQALIVADIAAVERSPVLGLPNSHGYWAIAIGCGLLALATAAIAVRVAIRGVDALPKPSPEEMPV